MLWAAAYVLVCAHGLAGVTFVEVSAQVGLDHRQQVVREPGHCAIAPAIGGERCELERMTGGAAVADYDGDGWPDVYLTRFDGPDALFRNVAGQRFENVAPTAGLAIDAPTNGAAWGDLDNDGDPDLVVARVGARSLLFENRGDGTFEEVGAARGLDLVAGFPGTTSIALGDVDRDGYLDLYLTEWQARPVPCAQTGTRLFHNRGAAAPASFEDVTYSANAGLIPPAGAGDLHLAYGFAPAFVDLDADGWLDLTVASDFGTSRLLWNRGDGTFTDGTAFARVGTEDNGMGSTFGDVDGDGHLDWFVSSIADPEPFRGTGNRLFRNGGDRSFEDITDRAGVRDGAFGWGASFFDVDLDGDLDLALTNGMRPTDAFEDDATRLWENDGGRFVDRAAAWGLQERGSGKALVTFDYDRDGDLDVLIVRNGEGPALFRNDLETGPQWLRVRAVGHRSNRDGHGVTVIADDGAHRQTRQIGVGSHFLGHGETVAHFGLGQSGGTVRVGVQWPGRETAWIEGVRPGQTLVVDEPADANVGPTRDYPAPRDCNRNGLPDRCEAFEGRCPEEQSGGRPHPEGPPEPPSSPSSGCALKPGPPDPRLAAGLALLLLASRRGRSRRRWSR